MFNPVHENKDNDLNSIIDEVLKENEVLKKEEISKIKKYLIMECRYRAIDWNRYFDKLNSEDLLILKIEKIKKEKLEVICKCIFQCVMSISIIAAVVFLLCKYFHSWVLLPIYF